MGAIGEDSRLNFQTSEDVTVVETFEKMGLNENLLRGVFQYGTWLGYGPGELVWIITMWI